MSAIQSPPMPIPAKPDPIMSEDDAWNYVVWFNLTHGTEQDQRPAHHPDFWPWFRHYRQCGPREREQLDQELGFEKLKQSKTLLKIFFDRAKNYRSRERLRNSRSTKGSRKMD